MAKFAALDGVDNPDPAGPDDAPRRNGDGGEIHLLLSITNLACLIAAYGEAARPAACDAVGLALSAVGRAIAKTSWSASGCAMISLVTSLPRHALGRHLVGISARLGDHVFQPAVAFVDIPPFAGTLDGDARHPHAPSGCPAGRALDGAADAGRCREDMMWAAPVLRDIAADRIDLTWQAVRHSARGAVLYQACRIRAFDRRGEDCLPRDVLLSIERLGFARLLDEYVVSHVLDELEASRQAVLAVTLSAGSAVLDAGWASVFERLRASPLLAARFIIEIAEGAALPALAQAVAFADAVRALGCRIALDDFRMDDASVAHALALRPDIVKVDTAFHGVAGCPDPGRDRVRRTIGLPWAFAPLIVVKGIATEIDSERATLVGVPWQQGCYWGSPSSVHMWRAAAHSGDRRDA